jgi:hypothetical protein
MYELLPNYTNQSIPSNSLLMRSDIPPFYRNTAGNI